MGSFFPSPFSQGCECHTFFTALYMLQGASAITQQLQPGQFSQHFPFLTLGLVFCRVYILQHLIFRDVRFLPGGKTGLISSIYATRSRSVFQERPVTDIKSTNVDTLDTDKQVKDQIQKKTTTHVQNRIKK